MTEASEKKKMDQLRKERSATKTALKRKGKGIIKKAPGLLKEELLQAYTDISRQARQVEDANNALEDALLAEGGEEAELTAQDRAGLENTTKECDEQLTEVELTIQKELWSRYGEHELIPAIEEAELVCGSARDVIVDSIYLDAFREKLALADEYIKKAGAALTGWERWLPDNANVLVDRVRALTTMKSKLELKMPDFITARKEAEKEHEMTVQNARATNRIGAGTETARAVPIVRLKPTSLPIFSGNMREFHRWRKDWENLQKQGEPSGSLEVKKFQLLDSINEKVVKDLRLASYNTAEDMFRVLENRFGDKSTIAVQIIEELSKIPAVKGDQPRKTIDLIQAVEKALADLTDLDDADAMNNRLVIKSIEIKLPLTVKRDWLIFMNDSKNGVTPDNHFNSLLAFLKMQEDILERLEQLTVTDASERSGKPERKFEKRFASTRATGRKSEEGECVVCGDGKHKNRLFSCKTFRGLDLPEKKAAVKKAGACRKCLESHDTDGKCSDLFLCNKKSCLKGESTDHHFLLCPKREVKKESDRPRENGNGKKGRLTDEQEEALSKLTPEAAEMIKKAFTNKAAVTCCAERSKGELLAESGVREYPVIMMLMEVTANAGQKVGALIDLASDTNYITHKAASRLGLKSENITLVVQGVGGMAVTVNTSRYLLKVRVKTSRGTERAHQLVCYGLDEIARVHRVVEPQQLKRFFPKVEMEELVRPKQIELLISHREGRLAPQRIKIVGDLVLWESPLGKTVGGAHPSLFEEVEVATHESTTHFARSMRTAAVKYREIIESPGSFGETKTSGLKQEGGAEIRSTTATNREVLEWLKWDSIGAACEPKCGGCRCGGCQPGGKEMTLGEERELETIKEGLTYVAQDNHCKSPHWDAEYPWTEDPSTLPNNRKGVEATFLKTEKRLLREPEWQTAYAAQVHDMVERGAAVKLTREMIDNWRGPVWYVSHLVAPNPHSVTTPVRLVWNSSQKFKGVSLNDLLLKGPDVLNPVRAVLLRFRTGEYAALGDIRKMYNSVWLKEREVHLHRFLWRDNPEEEICEYAITRVNIGDRPAGCIAQLAMRETARLARFSHMQEERRVLEEDSYVDDVLTSHCDLKKLDDITRGVEEILTAGGFSLKPWIRSGQGGRRESGSEVCDSGRAKSELKTLVLPNQLRDEDNKALGIGYHVDQDQLYAMTSINFSRRKGKMRLGLDLREEEVRLGTPKGLSRRELLSQIAALYDPVGLVTPAKQKGTILVRRAFQEVGSGSSVKDSWDDPLPTALRDEAIRLFEEYVRLSQVKFHRSLTPSGWTGKPWGVTFSDGSDSAYGAVMYLRWETQQGVEIRLVESKAKLTPLDQKGDAVKAEVCGAVFAARLKKFVEKHGRLQIERWFHLVDSRTVLGAIQRESYGYQTFFANRIGEIQKAGPANEWWWIPGELNIADIITRGAAPESLDEDSEWQRGPEFLRRPLEEWPVKSAAEVASDARESVSRLQRKAFSAILTRAQSRKAPDTNQESTEARTAEVENESERRPSSSPITGLVEPERFSSLSKVCRVIAWVWRAAKEWLRRKGQSTNLAKQKAKHLDKQTERPVLTARERENALRDLFLAVQEGVTFPETTLNRLVVYRDESSGLLMCGGRVQMWDGDRTAVPILPHGTWVSTLLAREAHETNHEGVAGTLLRMRKKAWVVHGKRVAKKVVDSCIFCRKERARKCKQVMSDLPPERVTPAAPFAFTSLDLFGPYEARDGKRRRVKLKVWGVVFSCMASRAVHADIVEDQSAEGLLTTYMRFTALRGHPRKLWSDPGTNFIGARPALENLYEFLDSVNKSQLEEEAAKHGTEWSWKIHPADSPHRNGAAEAAVKVMKKALRAVDREGPFTVTEFQTLLYLAANLANERPIEARVQVGEDSVEYLSPNSLLLGRSGPKGDSEGFDWEYPFERFRAVQRSVDGFWQRWSQLAGPNLFTRPKWHTQERNVTVGDLVWLADQNALRGQFRLGRVVQAAPDPAGVVRDVQVRTVSSCPASPEEVKGEKRRQRKAPGVILHRDVRRLVVLLPVEEMD